MARGMARRRYNLDRSAREIEGVAIAHGLGQSGDLCSLGSRSDDLWRPGLGKIRDALDMIGVVMGDEQVRELPSVLAETTGNPRSVRGVDTCGLAGQRIMQDDAEIVLPAGKLLDQEAGHGSS